MHPKWVALIAAWFAVGTMVSVCAIAWGNEGRNSVVIMGITLVAFLGVVTGGISGDDAKIEKAKIERDTARNAATTNTGASG